MLALAFSAQGTEEIETPSLAPLLVHLNPLGNSGTRVHPRGRGGPCLPSSPSAHLGWASSPGSWEVAMGPCLGCPQDVLRLLVAATALSLPALEELPSQGAEQKPLTDGPP